MLHTIFQGLDPQQLGTHRFAFIAALRCKEVGLSEEAAEQLIDSQEGLMPRYFKLCEVGEAVASADNSERQTAPKWPRVDRSLQQRIIAKQAHVTIAALQQCSLEPLDQEPKTILEKLFHGSIGIKGGIVYHFPCEGQLRLCRKSLYFISNFHS
jgi:hypothetical protein